jgi:hypothetical protein
MTGIVATLETGHRSTAIGQEIDNLALALITPLGANDDDAAPRGHSRILLIQRPLPGCFM